VTPRRGNHGGKGGRDRERGGGRACLPSSAAGAVDIGVRVITRAVLDHQIHLAEEERKGGREGGREEGRMRNI